MKKDYKTNRGKMYMSTALFNTPLLTTGQRLILAHLLSQDVGVVNRTQQAIASSAGVSVITVKKAIELFEKHDLIIKTRHPFEAFDYLLTKKAYKMFGCDFQLKAYKKANKV